MGKGTRSAVLAKKAIRRGKPVKISKIASKQVPLADQQQYVRLQQAGDVAACLSLAEAFTRDHPESAFAWKTLASSLLKSDRLDEAEEAIERAASLVVDDPEIHNNRGSIYFAQGRDKQLSQTGGELIRELLA